MLNKITQIVSVSRFKDFSSNNVNLELKQANLLYAPNGRGKTTIADIVRSLIHNDPLPLAKRASRVYPGNMEVTVKHGDPSVTSRFNGAAWSNVRDTLKCLVFDKDFINRNIHTVTVSHEHKKKLHGLIVGEGAIEAKVTLAEKRDALAAARKEQTGVNHAFALLGLRNITLEDFSKLSLQSPEKLSTEKESLNKQLEALGNPEKIKNKPVLQGMKLPDFDTTTLSSICALTVNGGSSQAIDLIQSHITSHIKGTDQESKTFIANSVKAMGSKEATNCALCGQTINQEAKKLVNAMFTIFSAEYLSLRKNVNNTLSTLDQLVIGNIFSQISHALELNQVRHLDWSTFINKLPEATLELDTAQMEARLTDARANLARALREKRDDLSIIIEKELNDFCDAWKILNDTLRTYHLAISTINVQINTYKDTLDVNRKQAIANRIAAIDNALVRSSDTGKEIHARYADITKKMAEADKAHRKALGDFTVAQQTIINEHGDRINQVLAYCGAKFRLDNLIQGSRTNSTEPYLEYYIKLNGGTQESKASAVDALSEILSDGEKNLLAFAFFWSLVMHHQLDKVIVILDDPLTSIDIDWRTCLIEKLDELCKKGINQLFILTHYSDFAQLASRYIANLKELTVEDRGAAIGHRLEVINIEDVVREEQFVRIRMFESYLADPTTQRPEHIQAEVRKILESALKHKYYLKLRQLIDSNTAWLRDFINHPEVKPILEANNSYEELNTLCTTAGWGNHDNPLYT